MITAVGGTIAGYETFRVAMKKMFQWVLPEWTHFLPRLVPPGDEPPDDPPGDEDPPPGDDPGPPWDGGPGGGPPNNPYDPPDEGGGPPDERMPDPGDDDVPSNIPIDVVNPGGPSDTPLNIPVGHGPVGRYNPIQPPLVGPPESRVDRRPIFGEDPNSHYDGNQYNDGPVKDAVRFIGELGLGAVGGAVGEAAEWALREGGRAGGYVAGGGGGGGGGGGFGEVGGKTQPGLYSKGGVPTTSMTDYLNSVGGGGDVGDGQKTNQMSYEDAKAAQDKKQIKNFLRERRDQVSRYIDAVKKTGEKYSRRDGKTFEATART